MFNKNKLKIEKNNVYKKIFRYEETVHRNLAAAKDALPSILKELSAPKLESKQDHSPLCQGFIIECLIFESFFFCFFFFKKRKISKGRELI